MRLACGCGRIVDVPSLDVLRVQADLPPYTPGVRRIIESMLFHGELPTLTTCAQCGCATSGTMFVDAQIARGTTEERGGVARMTLALFIALVTAMAIGIALLGRVYLIIAEQDHSEGNERNLDLPVRICPACKRQWIGKPLSLWLAWLATSLFVVVGVALVIIWTAWGGMFVLAALLPFGALRAANRRRQKALRDLLRQEPIFDDLLDDYPYSHLVVNAARGDQTT